MAVAFDANATADTPLNVIGTTGLSATTLTVGSGANRVLVVSVCFSNQAVTSVAVVWDSGASNQALTLIKSANTTAATGRAELWGLVNPIAGAKTLTVKWNAVVSDAYMNGTSWTGADQTGGATTFPHSTSVADITTGAGTPLPTAIVITSAVGNATMTSISTDATAGSLSASTQTATFTDNSLSTDAAGSRAAGAATVTHNWTDSTINQKYVIVGTDIAVPATATYVPYQPWYQVAPIVAQ